MNLPCPVLECKILLSSRKCLLTHIKLDHGRKVSFLKCKINNCGIVSSSRRNYESHISRYHKKEIEVNSSCGSIDTAENSTSNLELTTMTEGDENNTCTSNLDNRHCLLNYMDENEIASGNDNNNTGNKNLQTCHPKLIFFEKLLKLCITMKEKYTLPHSVYTNIMDDTINLFSSFHEDVLVFCSQQEFLSPGSSRNMSMPSLISSSYESELVQFQYLGNSNSLTDLWQQIQSKELLKSYLKTKGHISGKTVKLKDDDGSYQYISIVENLNQLLKNANIIKFIENPQKPARYMEDFPDGSNFYSHSFFKGNKSIIRLHLYADEIEICNPLGSSKTKHKLYCFYYFIGNMPIKYASSLKHIYLALVVLSSDVKKYGFTYILKPLISDLIYLQEVGIVCNEKVKYAALATVSADNLGAHEIAGFRRCFSSGKICRFCDCDYKDLKRYSSESQFNLREKGLHYWHLSNTGKSNGISESCGVTGRCPFDQIPSFNVLESFPPDIMHDVLEGAVPLVLKTIFNELHKCGILSINEINKCLSKFKYNSNDIRNKPSARIIVHNDGAIKLNATESLCLFQIIPFALPPCIFSHSVWKVYVVLSQILNIILAPKVLPEWVSELDELCQEFYNILLVEYPEIIRPKLHFMLHYATCFQKFGSLKRFWCMRFESFHTRIKRIATSLKNFINIPLTVTTRLQMQKFLEISEDIDTYECEPTVIEVEKCQEILSNIKEYLIEKYSCTRQQIQVVRRVQYLSYSYKKGDIFSLGLDSNDGPMFVFLNIIFLICHKHVAFCGNYLNTSWHTSTQSYIISKTDDVLFFKITDVLNIKPLGVYNCGDETHVKLYNRLCE